jgi:hypothetical protein
MALRAREGDENRAPRARPHFFWRFSKEQIVSKERYIFLENLENLESEDTYYGYRTS